jgi:hypothetical protein
MANANNMAAARPRASFQTAGGVIIKFRHPLLAFQLGDNSPVDEVDVSASLKLNDTFFQATPAQDSAFQEVLVDGSVVTITNHLMNGQATLQVLQTTGFVGTGDLIACAHLIIASKDDVGGTLTVIRNFNGKKRIRAYYGVSFKNVPHEIIAGNSVVVYPVVMSYSGWVEGIGSSNGTKKAVWAVGNRYGLTANYNPYNIDGKAVDTAENGDYYGGEPYGNVDSGSMETAAIGPLGTGAVFINEDKPAPDDTNTPNNIDGAVAKETFSAA